jgi:glycosyltransferase involved in cell wall biosynthesis
MPTLYIDCSSTATSLINTGIQRVVRNLARHTPAVAASAGYQVKLVAIDAENGEFSEITLNQFQEPRIGAIWQQRTGQLLRMAVLSGINRLRRHLENLFEAPAWTEFINAPYYRPGLARCILFPYLLASSLFKHIRNHDRSDLQPASLWSSTDNLSADILLLADAGWDRPASWPAAERFRERGGYVVTLIYDLIPVSHPQFYEPYLVSTFTHWITESVRCVDYYVCISKNTEIALHEFLTQQQGSAPTGHFYLGSDLDLKAARGTPSPRVMKIAAASSPLFLVVGSLEPRKNLGFVLDAFERAWTNSSDAKLVLVGHNTWRVDDLLDRIRQHPLAEQRLFWVSDASDTDLEYLYQKATALIFASIIEGFGLPIVEAMQRGLPVLCSDIPVFREIADGKANFFSLESTDELAEIIFQASQTPPGRLAYPWLSWKESAAILWKNIHSQFLLERPSCKAQAGT